MNSSGQKPRNVEAPEPGYFVMRFIKGGPLVAARICQNVHGWWAEIGGRACDEPASDPMEASMVFDIWLGAARQIDETEYERLLDCQADRRHPASRPKEPIALSRMKSLF